MKVTIVVLFLWLFNSFLVRGQVISFGMRKLAYSTNQFGLDLMRAMTLGDSINGQTNVAFCPFCISSSLSMMLAGSSGSMANSLRHALYLWGMQPSEINLATHDLMSHLGVNIPTGRTFRRMYQHQSHPNSLLSGKNISTANDVTFLTNIYVQRDFPINYHYHMLLQRFYKTAVHPLDFHFNGEETRQHINAIVERQTSGKIRNILPELPSQNTQLLLLSSLYFKGTLDLNMVPSTSLRNPGHGTLGHGGHGHNRTPGSPFNILDMDTLSNVMLESRQARIRHRFDPFLNCSAVEMPFKGGLITLVLLMPSDPNGLDMLLTRLSAQILTDVVNSLEVKRVNLKMPRLVSEKGNVNLTYALQNLGLSDLFKPGYSQLYDVSDYKWLSVSDIIHKTYLDIKESSPTTGTDNGGEKSTIQFPTVSTTSHPHHSASHHSNVVVPKQQQTILGQVSNNASPSDSSISVTFDKPFIYFVFDNISGLVMVMGKNVGTSTQQQQQVSSTVNYRLPIL